VSSEVGIAKHALLILINLLNEFRNYINISNNSQVVSQLWNSYHIHSNSNRNSEEILW
jgi:hypothetical protein